MVYHVFISYHHADKAEILPVVQYLRSARLAVYFDEEHVDPREALNTGLAAGISQSCTFLFCIGRSGVGNTHQLEAQHAYDRSVDGQCNFLTLLLPDARYEDMPSFCNRRPSLYFKPDASSPDPSHRLLCAVLGIRRGPDGKYKEELDAYQPSIVQAGPGFPAELTHNGHTRTETVYPLLCDPARPKLVLTWETWAWTIGKLEQQIARSKSTFHLDAYFGVNEAGLAIAMALNEARRPIGFLFHQGDTHSRTVDRRQCLFPALDPKASILLVDSQLKTGDSLRVVLSYLREHYASNDLRIYYAVLMAKAAVCPIRRFDQLLAWNILRESKLEDIFVCCQMPEGRAKAPYPK
jgi:hypothetical protein